LAPRSIQPEWFRTRAGEAVQRITLRNAGGMEVDVSSWGATITSIRVPDHGASSSEAPGSGSPPLTDLLLGWAYPPVWEDNPTYFGSTVGRVANRIAHGRFELDGQACALHPNLLPHHLHGGRRGFSHLPWEIADGVDGADGAVTADPDDGSSVTLRLHSSHGDEGYPGNLTVAARFHLDDSDTLTVDYRADTDAPTHVNLTNHAYFNLAGTPVQDGAEVADQGIHVHPRERRPHGPPIAPVLDHVLQIGASAFTVMDVEGIPTGEIRPVAGTPLDFTTPVRLGDHLPPRHPLLRPAGGFDHNLVLDPEARLPGGDRPAAILSHPASGRTLVVHTTLPGIQLYTSNGLKARGGTGGLSYGRFAGVCLETQFFPDTPNRPEFPSTRVEPGTPWSHRTSFTFSVQRP
jgi:aldose 1-epimerase